MISKLFLSTELCEEDDKEGSFLNSPMGTWLWEDEKDFFFFFMILYKKNEDGAVKVELLPMILSQGTASWAISSTPSALLPPLPGHHHQHHHHGYHFWSAYDGLGLHVHSLMVLPWQSCEVGTIFEVLMMGWVFTSTLSWYYRDSHVRWFSFFIFYGKGNWGSKKVRKLPLVPWCVEKNLTLPKERCGFPDNSVGKESACNSGTPVWFLGQEDPLEKGKATHFSILAWRIPWTVWFHGFTKSGTRQSNFHVQVKLWSLPWVSER